mgnify:CR=1 FL=1
MHQLSLMIQYIAKYVHRYSSRIPMILFLLGFLFVQAKPFYVHVSGISDQPQTTIQHRGASQELIMLPKGDNEWVGVMDTDSHHFLNIHISTAQKTFFHGIVRNQNQHIHFGYDNQNQSLQPYTQKGTREDRIQQDKNWLWRRGIWFLCAWFLMEFALRIPQKSKRSQQLPSLSTPLFFATLSFLWVGWNEGLAGVQYDTLGTYWFADRASTWNLLFDPNTNWPTGVEYKRLDSFVFFVVSIFFQWLPTSTWLPLFSITALTLSGWAASQFAQELGATRQASWLAGITFIFHGLTASALLEGHVYHLLLPWLPLCLLFAWRATKTQKNTKNALYTAVFWFLCLLTSAYLGLATTIALVMIWFFRKGWNIKSTYAGIGCIAVLSIAYMLLYTDGQAVSSGRDATSMMVGSINLSNFFGFTPQVDQELHAQSLGILAIPLFLALGAHRYTHKRQDTHILWLIAMISLCFSFGCFVSLASVNPIFPMPLLWLSELPLFRSIGFPIRLSWPFLLCIGILASLAASKIRYLPIILALCVAEIFLSNQLDTRQQQIPYTLPKVYDNTSGASLEIFPITPSGKQHSDLPMWFSAYSCFFQTEHHQPIAENCISTISKAHNRIPLANDIVQNLLSGDSFQAWETLKKNQFAHIMIYPDLYTSGDYKRLAYALRNHTKEESTQIWYMERYTDSSQQKTVQKNSPNTWGEKVLETADTITFRISSPIPLSHLTINKQKHVIQKEPVTGLYRSQCTQTINTKAEVIIFDSQNNSVWNGYFFPAASQESLYIDIPSGWLLASPYTTSNPINKEVGTQSKWIWCILLIFGGFVWCIRHLYPIGDIGGQENNTDTMT